MANEKRLIDANTLKWKLGHVSLYVPWLRFGKTVIGKILESYHWAVLEEIDNAITVDAVEVVRCKDCFADGCCSVQIDLDMGGDGYCSKGKRRTDNG